MAKESKKYAILHSPAAARDLKKLRKKNRTVLRSIDKSILSLADDPRPHGAEPLQGDTKYRKRDGEYRILYEIDDEKSEVTIHRVRHRKDVYRG